MLRSVYPDTAFWEISRAHVKRSTPPGFSARACSLMSSPDLGGGAVLAAGRVGVNVGGGGHRRVAEAFADGRDVHAPFQQEARVAVAHRVERCSLGKLQRPAK